MRRVLALMPLVLALTLLPSAPAEAVTRKCGKPPGWTKDGRIHAVNIRCPEARLVFRRYTFGRVGIRPCNPCFVSTDFYEYRCVARPNYETNRGRVTCRRSRAHFVRWAYSFVPE